MVKLSEILVFTATLIASIYAIEESQQISAENQAAQQADAINQVEAAVAPQTCPYGGGTCGTGRVDAGVSGNQYVRNIGGGYPYQGQWAGQGTFADLSGAALAGASAGSRGMRPNPNIFYGSQFINQVQQTPTGGEQQAVPADQGSTGEQPTQDQMPLQQMESQPQSMQQSQMGNYGCGSMPSGSGGYPGMQYQQQNMQPMQYQQQSMQPMPYQQYMQPMQYQQPMAYQPNMQPMPASYGVGGFPYSGGGFPGSTGYASQMGPCGMGGAGPWGSPCSSCGYGGQSINQQQIYG